MHETKVSRRVAIAAAAGVACTGLTSTSEGRETTTDEDKSITKVKDAYKKCISESPCTTKQSEELFARLIELGIRVSTIDPVKVNREACELVNLNGRPNYGLAFRNGTLYAAGLPAVRTLP